MNPYQTPSPIAKELATESSVNDRDEGFLANPFFWIMTFLVLLGVAPFVPAIVAAAIAVF